MLLPMLKAVSKMLDFKNITANTMGVDGITQVKCAKTILDELINGLEGESKPVSRETHGAKPNLAPRETLEERSEDWMITVDENKGLQIAGFPLDRMLEVDGKTISYGQARGQKFTRVRIL